MYEYYIERARARERERERDGYGDRYRNSRPTAAPARAGCRRPAASASRRHPRPWTTM